VFVDAYVLSLSEDDRAKVMARIDAVTITLAAVEQSSTQSTISGLVKNILSSATPPVNALIQKSSSQGVIALGDYSHKAELDDIDVGIIDHGTYPCSVEITAEAWFRGPNDKKINRKPRGKLKPNTLIPTSCEIDYTAKTNAPMPYDVYWQVVNTGEHARQQFGLRGEIFQGTLTQTERSLYTGKHWIECFIVTKEGVCIARSGPFYVMFRNPQFPLQLPR